MKKLSIIIPAHNEEKRIGNTLNFYSSYFENLRKTSDLGYEIIVVINNTSDGTEEIVKSIQEKNSRINFINLPRGGKGYAVIEGFKQALKGNSEFIGFVDADMATPPDEYFKLANSLKEAHGVIADRYLKDSKIIPIPSKKRIIARKLFNFVIRSSLFLPFRDTQCGAKIFRRKALENVIPQLTMSQWAFDVELLYALKKNNYKIRAVPTVWTDKEYSKINFWKAGPWMALGVLRLRIVNSPAKRFIRVYDKLIGFIPR